MSQFFDDLCNVILFRYQAIHHYFYSLLLILLIILPYAFLGVLGSSSSRIYNNWFVSINHYYLYYYIVSLLEISIDGIIFSLILFRENTWIRWKNIISFISLIFFIKALSLVFFLSPSTYFLAYFVMLFSTLVMLIGLKTLSGQSITKVMFSWIIALLLTAIAAAVMQLVFLKLNWIDQTKYDKQIHEIAKQLTN